jgi:hypothetical protein
MLVRRARPAVTALATTLAGLVGLIGLVGCSDDGGTPSPHATPATAPAAALAGAQGPTRHVGPQGRVGQFVVHCTYSHSGAHDPIVHPGHEGRSHRHDFYGAVTVDSQSTAESLVDDETTCDKRADTAAYWQPTLYDHGEVVEPSGIAAYYRAAPGVDPTEVEPFPFGIALIAGDQTATEPQPGEAVGWVCGSRTQVHDEPPTCPRSAPLRLMLTFQDCWDGEHLDSADHRSHAAYSEDGRCPASHPVHLPQLTVSVMFPIWGDGHELTLASGNVFSAHGDFFNAWDPDGLRREVEQCIHRGSVCDLASNRDEEPLFTG